MKSMTYQQKSIEGIVIDGKKLGRTIGFPTANIQLEQPIKLEKGVYAVRVSIEGELYEGVMNLGERPTFDDGLHTTCEVHILNFSRSIYGQRIEVHVQQFIRPEIKFDGLQSLIEQLKQDVLKASVVLQRKLIS